MNRAFGLAIPPAVSTACQSDQVLSGAPVFPVRVENSIALPVPDFHDGLPHEETESVSFTFDSYVPDVANESPIRNNFPIFADVAYSRSPTASNRVVCSSVDSSRSVVFLFEPSSE